VEVQPELDGGLLALVLALVPGRLGVGVEAGEAEHPAPQDQRHRHPGPRGGPGRAVTLRRHVVASCFAFTRSRTGRASDSPRAILRQAGTHLKNAGPWGAVRGSTWQACLTSPRCPATAGLTVGRVRGDRPDQPDRGR